MSIFVGYWSNRQTTEDLQQLLIKSVADLSPTQTTNDRFGIAIYGRHTRFQSSGDVESSLTATLAAGGKHLAPDVWARASNDELVLGREPFGRATIFWTQTQNAIWFSTRLALLLRILNKPTVSIDGFHAYGCYSFVPAPLTPIENVFAVRAGTEMSWHSLEAVPASRALHEWREAEVQIKDETAAARQLRKFLEENVEVQLAKSAGEVAGIFLSGGLDSSVTAALLARAGVKLRAYTLDFAADCPSEVANAEIVARSLRIPLTKIPITANTMRRALRSTATRLDGLYGDSVTVPLAIMYQRARDEVETVFNGEGGDQLFAGWTNKPLIAASVYENSVTQTGSEPFSSLYARTFHRLQGLETNVYTAATLRQIDAANSLRAITNALDPTYTSSLLHRLRRANLMLKGADNIQPRATNLGLSYGLDVRTLFCSRPLAEFTFSVSDELWLRAGCEKYLLKRAVEDLLPSEILWREKRGMGVPLTLWLNGPLRRWCQRMLRHRVLASEGLWQADLAERLSTGELSGQVQGRRIGEALWLLLMWRAWREQMVACKPATVSEASSARPFSLNFISALKRAWQ